MYIDVSHGNLAFLLTVVTCHRNSEPNIPQPTPYLSFNSCMHFVWTPSSILTAPFLQDTHTSLELQCLKSCYMIPEDPQQHVFTRDHKLTNTLAPLLNLSLLCECINWYLPCSLNKNWSVYLYVEIQVVVTLENCRQCSISRGSVSQMMIFDIQMLRETFSMFSLYHHFHRECFLLDQWSVFLSSQTWWPHMPLDQ